LLDRIVDDPKGGVLSMSRLELVSPGTVHDPKTTRRVLLVTCGAALMAFLDVTIVNIAFPSIRAGFGATSLPTLSWILNGYNVAFAALLVPAGRYADSFGRRRSYLVGMAGFTLASIVAGSAPSVGILIAARSIQALGAAILVPTSLALLLDAFPLERRASAVGLWGAAAAVAAALGPSLGGALVAASSWRLVFFVNVLIGIGLYLLARSLPEVRSRRDLTLPDPLGIILLLVAIGLLALGIVQGQAWGWSSARISGSLAGAVVFAALFILRARLCRSPAVEMRLFTNWAFSSANLGTLLFAAAFYAMLLNNVLFLTGVWGYTTITAGLALTPAPLLAAMAAGPAGRVADRFGQRVVVVPGLLFYLAGASYLLLSAGPDPSYLAEFLPAAALTGIGVGLAFPALGSAAVHALSDTRYATGSAINSAARQIGAVLAIAIVVNLLSVSHRSGSLEAFRHVWVLTIVAAGSAVPFGLLLSSVRASTRPVASPAGASSDEATA
jgi:EmrB/QacA subfamily drug resistance transporter